jgi:CRP/FNR family cyclic AMP-dependent transcriptional regulator
MMTFTPELHQCCFGFLSEEEAQRVCALMTTRELAPGEVLFSSGQQSEEIYFLLAGKLAVQQSTGFGNRMQVVALLDPGAVVGESGILPGRNRGATVVAASPSWLGVLTCRQFAELSTSAPVLGRKILFHLLDRLTLRLQKSSERLARVL